MNAPASDGPGAPRFHAGEVRVQERLGVARKMAGIGARVIRDHLIEQHRAFYATQHMLLLGHADDANRPWASVLAGPPGFACAPDPHRLRIDALPAGGAPHAAPIAGERVGLLGIDYSNRRRNRVNGRIATRTARGFEVHVEHAFGNCPQYIQTREVTLPDDPRWRVGPVEPRRIRALAGAAAGAVARADHFYVATHHPGDAHDARDGADVSHRGGRPGFARVLGDEVIEFPDFAGNRFFNTLGNIEATGRAGLLFIDVDDASLYAFTGRASIDWRDAGHSGFAGAERLVRVAVEEGWVWPRALPLRWRLLEPSPALAGTGTWADAAR